MMFRSFPLWVLSCWWWWNLVIAFRIATVAAFTIRSSTRPSSTSTSSTTTTRIINTTTRTSSSSATSRTRLHSIPNALDTFTSGLASICRLPKGVTAMEIAPTPDGQLDVLPQMRFLWDVENSPDCRAVREALTELDVVVQVVIPATPNSRALIDPSNPYYYGNIDDNDEAMIPPRLVVKESNGEELVLNGRDMIMAYLQDLKEQELTMTTTTTATTNEDDDDTQQRQQKVASEWIGTALKLWDVVGNNLATACRVGRGTKVTAAAAAAQMSSGGSKSNNVVVLATNEPPRPDRPLVLYSYEGNQFCRLVREVLTELDLAYELRSAGKQSPRRSELAYITGGSSQCPYLIDPNTGADLLDSQDIIAYLYKTYARWTPPNEVLQWTSQVIMPLFQPIFRFTAPLQAKSSYNNDNNNNGDDDEEEDDSGITMKNQQKETKQEIERTIQQHPVVVYTYDLSPFCTEATALLERLDIPFHQVSLGKEWIPGLITPTGAQTRAALLEMTGQSSLPHVFIGGKSIGGLFSGTPGLIPALEAGRLDVMVESASTILEKRKSFRLDNTNPQQKATSSRSKSAAASSSKREEEDAVGAFE